MEDLRHADIHEYDTPAYKKRRRRFLDRREGRRVRTLPPMLYAMSYIMKDRNDSTNLSPIGADYLGYVFGSLIMMCFDLL